MTTVGELRDKASCWINRPPAGPAPLTVESSERADRVAWDKISDECSVLATMDKEFAEAFGTTGLVADLWMAAYAREPQLRDASETAPAQRSQRAVAAAMLGTPEHNDMRALTAGDAYAAAMSVLAQKTALRRMLRQLDPDRRQRRADSARKDADAAATQVAKAFEAAQDAAAANDQNGQETDDEVGRSELVEDAEPDAQRPADGQDEANLDGLPVPHPELVDTQRAITEAEAADADAERAEQASATLGAGDHNGDQAMMMVRAAARQACAEATEALDAEASAMTAWGVGAGECERLDADARMRLARTLQNGKMRKFAELVGRFQQMAQAQRARRVEHARGEYVGVTIDDDLTSLLPAELVNLALPQLRAQFAVRYAEKQLMVYDQRGEENEGQGAVIVCVDCSDSMNNIDANGISGEAYAKAFALALLDQARNAKPAREYAAILFSHDTIPAMVFPADEPVRLADRIKLAETFPGGGTNFQRPLGAAAKLLEAEYNKTGRQRADIIFVTDGEAPLADEWLKQWHETKKRLGFRCFGIQIGWWSDKDDADRLDTFCDDVRRIDDLADTHATADLFRAI
jgi:uncharacterized protein with von Willebrand factor type A (vWA) domain